MDRKFGKVENAVLAALRFVSMQDFVHASREQRARCELAGLDQDQKAHVV